MDMTSEEFSAALRVIERFAEQFLEKHPADDFLLIKDVRGGTVVIDIQANGPDPKMN